MNTNGKAGRRRLAGIVAINGLLLAVLGAVTFAPNADAQSRSRGNYTMVAGRAQGATGGVVYIVDTTNEELVAVTWDPNQKVLSGIGYRNLALDAGGLGRGGGR